MEDNRTMLLEAWNDYFDIGSRSRCADDRPTEAQTDLQILITIALSQAKQVKDPIDWSNNFNLALYYLAAGQVGESRGMYDRASEASTDSIEDAIRDLDDYLMLFPDRVQAKEIWEELRMEKGDTF